ncbi:MAG TPA: thrombospondin type 3 repeat-containing protein [Gaiellaceae bacterium]
MDWDVEPTAFSEFVSVVTIAGSERAKNVLFSSDNGFASANPLSGASQILFSGDATDSGPADHGALFDFGFGTLKPGGKVTFNIFYGAAGSEPEADTALGTVRAEVYSYGQPNCPSFRCPDVNGPKDGKPNTFIFAFSKVGGEPIKPTDTDADGVLDELDNCPFTANASQADANLDGIGNACTTPALEHTTAGFLQAGLDGTTSVEPESVRLTEEPPLTDRLVRIVRFRLDAGLATDAAALTRNLVDSLVESGLVPPGGADALVADVIAHLDTTPPIVKVTFPAPDGKNGWFVHSPVTGIVTADDPSKVAGIVCTGATLGAIVGLDTTSASAPLTVSGDGTHNVSCTAGDRVGNTGAGPGSSATATVKVDTTVPAVTCSASPNTLWPPNHKLVAVTTTVSVDDGLSGPDGFKLKEATSSEPDDGLGDGDTADDLQGWTIGTADTEGLLRAERSGNGPGRTYTLTYTGADVAGNTATCAALVRVPHDQMFGLAYGYL